MIRNARERRLREVLTGQPVPLRDRVRESARALAGYLVIPGAVIAWALVDLFG